MDILLIAPNQPDLDINREIRSITSLHNVLVLSGKVTADDIYDVCRPPRRFKIVHFASHGDSSGVLLSDGEVLGLDDIGKICRMVKARCAFFNSCTAGVPATAVTWRGVDFAVYAQEDVTDIEALRMAAAFYSMLQNGHENAFLQAFVDSAGGNPRFGFAVSPTYLSGLFAEVAELQDKVRTLDGKVAALEATSEARSRTTDITIPRKQLYIGVAIYAFLFTTIVIALAIMSVIG